MNGSGVGDMRGGAGPLLLKHTSRTNEMFSAAASTNKVKNMSRIDTFTRRLSILDNTGSISKTLDMLKEDEEKRRSNRKSFWQSNQHPSRGGDVTGSSSSMPLLARRSSGTAGGSSAGTDGSGGGGGAAGAAGGGRRGRRDSIVKEGSRKEFLFRTFLTKLQDHMQRAFYGWRDLTKKSSQEYKEIMPCITVLKKERDQRSDEDMEVLLHHLKGVKFFGDLEQDLQRELVRSLEVETVDEDTVVMSEGDVGYKFYIILCGRVSVWKGVPDQEDLARWRSEHKRLGVFKKGDSFGELALIKDGRRGAAIITENETVFATMEKADYLRTVRLVYERNVRERTDFLCRIPAFWSTNLPRLRDLCMYLQYNRFHIGKSIATQGEEQGFVYFIITGKVSVQMKLQPGSRDEDSSSATTGWPLRRGVRGGGVRPGCNEECNVVLGWKGPGDIIGECAFLPGCVNRASAIAKSEVETLRLSSQDFQARLNPKTVNHFREIALGYPSQRVIEVCMLQKERWSEYKNGIVSNVIRDLEVKRLKSMGTNTSVAANAGTITIPDIPGGGSTAAAGGGGAATTATMKTELPANVADMNAAAAAAAAAQQTVAGIPVSSLNMSLETLQYRKMRDSLPDYMSFLRSEAQMDEDDRNGMMDGRARRRKPKEVVLDNMFLCDNQSQYVEFSQRAAILKLNLRSAKGDDEYIDMHLLDDIYHKWNQLAVRFHAVCGRFTHSSFLAVIADVGRSARENLECAADMLEAMEEVAKACVESSKITGGSPTAASGRHSRASTYIDATGSVDASVRSFSRASFLSDENGRATATSDDGLRGNLDAVGGDYDGAGAAGNGENDDDDELEEEEEEEEDNVQDIVIIGALLSGDVFVTIRGPGKFVTQLYGEGNDRAERLCACTSVAQLNAHDFKNFVTVDVRIDESTANMLQEKFEVQPIYSLKAPRRRRSSLVDVFIQAREERGLPKVSYRGRNRAVIQRLLDEQVESIAEDQEKQQQQQQQQQQLHLHHGINSSLFDGGSTSAIPSEPVTPTSACTASGFASPVLASASGSMISEEGSGGGGVVGEGSASSMVTLSRRYNNRGSRAAPPLPGIGMGSPAMARRRATGYKLGQRRQDTYSQLAGLEAISLRRRERENGNVFNGDGAFASSLGASSGRGGGGGAAATAVHGTTCARRTKPAKMSNMTMRVDTKLSPFLGRQIRGLPHNLYHLPPHRCTGR